MVFAKNFEDLEVFKIAFKTSIEIHKISLNFPKIEQYELASQLRRSSKSICSNLAEGFSKQSVSKAEFKRFITICLGSCNETRVWLRYCLELGYLKKDEYVGLREVYLRIAKMLGSLRSNV
jgi:four helix bundle protein